MTELFQVDCLYLLLVLLLSDQMLGKMVLAAKKETTFKSREISCVFKGKLNNYLIETIDGTNAMVSRQHNNQPFPQT